MFESTELSECNMSSLSPLPLAGVSNSRLFRSHYFIFLWQVIDSISEGLLGRASILVNKLIDSPDVTSHTIKLSDSAGEATLSVSMTLRVSYLCYFSFQVVH